MKTSFFIIKNSQFKIPQEEIGIYKRGIEITTAWNVRVTPRKTAKKKNSQRIINPIDRYGNKRMWNIHRNSQNKTNLRKKGDIKIILIVIINKLTFYDQKIINKKNQSYVFI